MKELERMVFAQVYALELRAARVAAFKREYRPSLSFDDDLDNTRTEMWGDTGAIYENEAHRVAMQRATKAVAQLRAEGSGQSFELHNVYVRDVVGELDGELTRRSMAIPRLKGTGKKVAPIPKKRGPDAR